MGKATPCTRGTLRSWISSWDLSQRWNRFKDARARTHTRLKDVRVHVRTLGTTRGQGIIRVVVVGIVTFF